MNNIVRTSIQSSTGGAVKATGGKVFWIAASAGATGGAFQIANAATDTTPDVYSGTVAANTAYFHGPFLPDGIDCPLGIYCDIDGSNIILTIGYT